MSTDIPRRVVTVAAPDDRLFRAIARAGGIAVLGVMLLVGSFLAFRATEALSVAGPNFLTEQAWRPDSHKFGIAAVLVGTIIIALVAISIALPLSTGTALYIAEYAPRQIRGLLVSIVDLMAAIPSVVFGLWGFFFLQNNIVPVSRWISQTFGWIPLFAVDGFDPNDPLTSTTVFTSSSFIAGIVVAPMVTPIITSIMRRCLRAAGVVHAHEQDAVGLRDAHLRLSVG